MSLQEMKCAPCEGGVPPLAHDQVAELMKSVPDWTTDNASIERALKFKDFAAALAFLNRVGTLAEEEGHHPDLSLHSWNRLKIRLSTHAIGGLSQNDFIVAAKIDALLKAAS